MKKTLITKMIDFPNDFYHIVKNAAVYDSSCSPEARVYYIDRDDGYYIKRGTIGSLRKEAELTDYFHKKGLSTEILGYVSSDHDWMLSRAVKGEDCCDRRYLDDPKLLCDTIASLLRELHELNHEDCPVQNRTAEYLSYADRNHSGGVFDCGFLPDKYKKLSADQAITIVSDSSHILKADTLLHGDYCLPNIMLDDWKFSAFIDLGNAGVGDRHIDLFWGAWTLNFNLKTDKYRERFFDAYGKDKIDRDVLDLIGIIECFG